MTRRAMTERKAAVTPAMADLQLVAIRHLKAAAATYRTWQAMTAEASDNKEAAE